MSNKGNIYFSLDERTMGRNKITPAQFSKEIKRSINSVYHDIAKCIDNLKEAIVLRSWSQIEGCIDGLIVKMLDNENPETLFRVTPFKKQERETFVLLGGMNTLLKLFEPPLSHVDARDIPTPQIQRHVEAWNEALVLMREVCFAIPPVANTIFSTQHITFLFTLLSHDFVFENAMNLLEEVLAVRLEPYCLCDIPNLFSLIDKFTTRRLAHFCRVLALVLFEPEDRQIMESTHVLKSYDLLQLRRNRMSKGSSSCAIEKNQTLVIDMPHLLCRLVSLLRIANHGPTLSDLVRQNVAMPSVLTTEFFMAMSSSRALSEWDHFASLEKIVRGGADISNKTPALPYRDPRVHQTVIVERSVRRRATEARAQAVATTAAAEDPLHAVITGVGHATITDDVMLNGESESDDSDDEDQRAVGGAGARPAPAGRGPGGAVRAFDFGGAGMEEALMGMMRGMRSGSYTPQQAASELQFQAVSLAPHQVELLFVLCTLLSGRRKMDVQQKFASVGLADVLLEMYPRLSWDEPPFEGPNPMEHIHGPNCECNPESALRVQYLRLVHNFFDRDFHNNPIKIHLLSRAERRLLKSRRQVDFANEVHPSFSDLNRAIEGLAPHEQGLLAKIKRTLMSESVDSMYRFWLSSCLETFLRGGGRSEQLFVASSGVLEHLVRHICDHVGSNEGGAVSHIQTSFDLLGEIVKYDIETVALLERFLVSEGLLDRFMEVAMSSVVDSNVFLRSLFVTMHAISAHCRANGMQPVHTKEAVTDISTERDDEDNYNGGINDDDEINRDMIDGIKDGGGNQVGQISTAQNICSLPPSCVSRRGNYDLTAISIAAPIANLSTYSPSSDPYTLPQSISRIAEIGYLSHSWMQFSPGVLSEEAMRVGEEHIKASPSYRSKQGVRLSEPPTKKKSQASSLGFTSIRKAVKNIRRVTSSLLGREAASAPSSPSKGAVPGLDCVICLDDGTCESHKDIKGQSAGEVRDRLEAAGGTYCYEWTLPKEVRLLSTFLQQHEEFVIYEMMTSVTVGSITHENICCVNTTLLSLIIAHRRGRLAQLLHGVRYLARSRNPTGLEWLDKLRRKACADKKKAPCTKATSIDKKSTASGDFSAFISDSVGAIGRGLQEGKLFYGSTSDGADDEMCDSPVLINFRELLWYWSEYYLRRGRDRLSLEFSTHVPFRHWRTVVEILCQDDGSSLSLLRSPTLLPISPYMDESNFFTATRCY